MTIYTPSQVRCLLTEYRGQRNSDLERVLRALPFERMQILFMTVCLESWRNGKHDWPEKVGDWWGIGGSQVNKVVNEALETICRSLNGFAVDNELNGSAG